MPAKRKTNKPSMSPADLLAGWAPPPPGDLVDQIRRLDKAVLADEARVIDARDAAWRLRRDRLIRDVLIMLDTHGATALADLDTVGRSRISQIRSPHSPILAALPVRIAALIREARKIRDKNPGLTDADRRRGRETQRERLIDEADPLHLLPERDRQELGDRLMREAMAQRGRAGSAAKWQALLREVDPLNLMPEDLREAHALVMRHQRAVRQGTRGASARGRTATTVDHTTVVDGERVSCSCGYPERPTRRATAKERFLAEIDPRGTMSEALREAHVAAQKHRGDTARGTHPDDHDVRVDPHGPDGPVVTCACGWPNPALAAQYRERMRAATRARRLAEKAAGTAPVEPPRQG